MDIECIAELEKWKLESLEALGNKSTILDKYAILSKPAERQGVSHN